MTRFSELLCVSRSGRVAIAGLLAAHLLVACGEDSTSKPKPADAMADSAVDAQAETDAAADDAETGSDVFSIEAFVGDKDKWGKNKQRLDEVKAAGKGALKAGVAFRYLDGPVGVSMAGYGGRMDGRHTHWSDRLKGTAGQYGLQTIKALVLEVGGETMALVKSPMMSSESYLSDAIGRHLKKTHGLDMEGRVITMAGHSHHTTARYWPVPETLGNVGVDSFDAEVTEAVAALFASAVAEAYQNREDAEWGYAYQDDWDPNNEVYRDRRSDNDFKYGKDPRLDILAVRKKSDASPMAVVIHFGIHGTVFGGENDIFTEDAPGYVEHKFEELFFASEGKPVFGMFAQSSGGDASPAGDGLGHPPLARLERLGEAAAPKILNLYKTVQWSSETELAIRSQRIELQHERIYANRPWANEFSTGLGDPYYWGGWQCAAAGGKKGESMEGKPKNCVDLGLLIELLEAVVPHTAPHETWLTTARLGDIWMITLPGEPNWSIVKYAREEAAKRTWNGKPAHLMVIGYSQDHLLYLSHPDDWYLGGYEAEMSLWGPGGGPFMVDEGLAMMDAMMAGKNGPAFFAESPSLAPVPPYAPRAREKSLAAGTVQQQPAATVQRTQTVQFAANCGDPALGSPLLQVQKDSGGTFAPLPARHGWKNVYYDNSRYEIVSIYDPDPPQLEGKSVDARTHLWRFYWQVPADFGTGNYRFHLVCNVLTDAEKDGKPKTLTIDSSAFAVGLADGTTLTASLAGDEVSVEFRVPGVAQQQTSTAAPGLGKWISAGYRLLDRLVGHTALARVRTSLQVEVLDGSDAVVATATAAYDPTTDKNVAKLPSVPAGAKKVRAWVSSDATPAKVTASLPN